MELFGVAALPEPELKTHSSRASLNLTPEIMNHGVHGVHGAQRSNHLRKDDDDQKRLLLPIRVLAMADASVMNTARFCMKIPPVKSLFSLGVLCLVSCGPLFAANGVEEDPKHQTADQEIREWQKFAARIDDARKARMQTVSTLSTLLKAGKVIDPSPEDPGSEGRSDDATLLEEYQTAKTKSLKAKAEIEAAQAAQMLLEMVDEMVAHTESVAKSWDVLQEFFDDQTIIDPNPANGASRAKIAPGARVDDAKAHLEAYVEAKCAYLNSREFKTLFEKQFHSKRAKWKRDRGLQKSEQ